jgi:hypothetical protein
LLALRRVKIANLRDPFYGHPAAGFWDNNIDYLVCEPQHAPFAGRENTLQTRREEEGSGFAVPGLEDAM